MVTPLEIYRVVGDEHYRDWISLTNLSLHLKDGVEFGLVSHFVSSDTLMINSISKGLEPFTVGMNREIVGLVKSYDKVILMSTCKDSTALNKLMDDYHEKGVESFFTKGI